MIACSSLFYGLLAVSKLDMNCEKDPNAETIRGKLGTLLQAAFLFHLASLFLNCSLIPYFDVYSNCTAVLQRDIERGNLNPSEPDVWHKRLQPIVLVLEHALRLGHLALGIIQLMMISSHLACFKTGEEDSMNDDGLKLVLLGVA